MTLPKITTMLKYRRPAWNSTEEEFIARYIDTIPGIYTDRFGNRLLVREGSRTMISTHTDTVHWVGGKQRVEMRGDIVGLHASETEPVAATPVLASVCKLKPTTITLDGRKPARSRTKHAPTVKRPYASNCLGADDTAGVYAALRMIDAGVKATFVFHRAEEIGGKGSNWLAANHEQWIAGFDRCIALDRRGTADIITSQYGERCASDRFAIALGEEIGMQHKPAAGIFTDSANYMHLIPECSNVSIGYYNEHTSRETLDVGYLERVIERLVRVDWEALPIARDPHAMSSFGLDEMDELEEDLLDADLREYAERYGISLADLKKEIEFDEH